MWYFQKLARLYPEFRKEAQDRLWDARKLHPEFFDGVMQDLIEEHEYPTCLEFSTNIRRLQAKRQILKALTPAGHTWHIFKCDVCKGYDPEYPFHVELWITEELVEAKEAEQLAKGRVKP